MVKEDKKHDKLDKNEDAMIKEDKNLEEKEENDKKKTDIQIGNKRRKE